MKETPKKAWLITWEEGPDDERRLPRPKIISILPSRTTSRVVEEILKAVFVADYPLTLVEKFHFGLNAEQRQLCMHRDTGERFLYGSHEYMYARRVENLRRKILKDGTEELRWRELPRYKIDEKTQRPVIAHPAQEALHREKPK